MWIFRLIQNLWQYLWSNFKTYLHSMNKMSALSSFIKCLLKTWFWHRQNFERKSKNVKFEVTYILTHTCSSFFSILVSSDSEWHETSKNIRLAYQTFCQNYWTSLWDIKWFRMTWNVKKILSWLINFLTKTKYSSMNKECIKTKYKLFKKYLPNNIIITAIKKFQW